MLNHLDLSQISHISITFSFLLYLANKTDSDSLLHLYFFHVSLITLPCFFTSPLVVYFPASSVSRTMGNQSFLIKLAGNYRAPYTLISAQMPISSPAWPSWWEHRSEGRQYKSLPALPDKTSCFTSNVRMKQSVACDEATKRLLQRRRSGKMFPVQVVRFTKCIRHLR